MILIAVNINVNIQFIGIRFIAFQIVFMLSIATKTNTEFQKNHQNGALMVIEFFNSDVNSIDWLTAKGTILKGYLVRLR